MAERHVLTPRECQVLSLIAQGLSAKKIAANLQLSLHTVNDQTKSIYRKLNIGSRIEAMAVAVDMRLMTILSSDGTQKIAIEEDLIKIAVVEDHDILREVICTVLSGKGEYAVSGFRSVETMGVAKPVTQWDIVILDLTLPGESGLSYAKRLRQILPRVGLIMLTGQSNIESKLQAYSEGVDLYLTKPFDSQELLGIVGALARRIHAQRPGTTLTGTPLPSAGVEHQASVTGAPLPVMPLARS